MPGDAFGESGEGFIVKHRRTSTANIKEALLRIERFIATLEIKNRPAKVYFLFTCIIYLGAYP